MEEYTINLETERLILRKFTYDDANEMFENYCKYESVAKYVTWKAHRDVDETKKYLANVVLPDYRKAYTYKWAIVLKKTNQVIGCIDVVSKDLVKKSAEIGYALSEKYWGRGLMPEAGRVVVSYLFSQGFVRVWADHNVENLKSGRVMQKIGMTKEGTFRKFGISNNGTLVDCDVYSIINESDNKNSFVSN